MVPTHTNSTGKHTRAAFLTRSAQKLSQFEVPSWVAFLFVSIIALALSGCISARQPYGFDQKAMAQNPVIVAQRADPTITSALPSGGWSPQFYPGTGVKPGAVEPQSQPFTPKGIQSLAGVPPKPQVSPVDLPAPPMPLPESTAAPSSTLFGRNPIGRAAGFNNRGVNFGGTALGRVPRLNQPIRQSTVQVFPNTAPTQPPGFKVANINSGRLAVPAQPLSGPVYNVQNNGMPPALPQRTVAPQTSAPIAPPPPPPVAIKKQQQKNMQVFQQSQPIRSAPYRPQPQGPTFKMSNNMSAYAQRPVPRGANLVVSSNGYQVDTGDELNIRVLGENDLTGRYLVDSTGAITMPMISTVNVRGRTVSQISNVIQNRLRQGFLRTPSVSVEVISARPFYILGQVKKPGKYNFVNGLTVSQAIAIAGGYEPRARKGMVQVTRQTPQGPITAEVPNEEPLSPGDTIYIKQRWF